MGRGAVISERRRLSERKTYGSSGGTYDGPWSVSQEHAVKAAGMYRVGSSPSMQRSLRRQLFCAGRKLHRGKIIPTAMWHASLPACLSLRPSWCTSRQEDVSP